MPEEKRLATEQANARTAHIDTMDTLAMLRAMNDENRRVAEAVNEALCEIAAVVERAAAGFAQGGRLIYVGAGTSGRLGVMDAAECPPTFGVPADRVVGLIAGGAAALVRASALCEDDAEAGARELAALTPCENDTVIGISAAGAAPYVLGAMRAARAAGAFVASICCNPDTPMAACADVAICAETGPEAVTGSTRLKAGSAQKIILNLISTGVMIRCGKIYGNYMVDLALSNDKLRKRAARIVRDITGCAEQEAETALHTANSVRGALELLQARGGAKQ